MTVRYLHLVKMSVNSLSIASAVSPSDSLASVVEQQDIGSAVEGYFALKPVAVGA